MKCKALFLLLFLPLCSVAQNLVPNGSFEEYVKCPNGLDQLYVCSGWWNSRASCDYYNSCSEQGALSVPLNVFGYQDALDGNAYAGFTTIDVFPEYREHLMAQLIEPLIIGEEYYFSFYVSRAAYNGSSFSRGSNRHGIRFTNTIYDGTELNSSPVDNFAFGVNEDIIMDTLFWHQVKGSFIADSDYEYVIIGNFFDDNHTDTLATNELPVGSAYYFIDEVRVSTNQEYAWEVLSIYNISKQHKIQSYPNPVSNILIVEFDTTMSSYQIFDTNGKCINEEVRIIRERVDMNLNSYSKGLYLFRAYFEDGSSSSFKFIKN